MTNVDLTLAEELVLLGTNERGSTESAAWASLERTWAATLERVAGSQGLEGEPLEDHRFVDRVIRQPLERFPPHRDMMADCLPLTNPASRSY